VVGRNGSGKSSFAEALEVLFTGESKRWAGRSKIWKEGWRNLHQGHPAEIQVRLVMEGH
jgi:recombinational DNA repair ATPase RecF